MDVILILGADNSGKSTLVRCLSGLGRGTHKHPSGNNVALLNWGPSKIPASTFCLISSLNEGERYSGSRVSIGQKNPFGAINTVSPQDLDAILDSYAVTKGCSKAILCVSTSVTQAGWRLVDYLSLIVGGMIGQHRISALVGLGAANPNVASVTFFGLPSAPHPRNDIAADARLNIALQ